MPHFAIMLVDDDPSLLTAMTGMLRFRLPHIRVNAFDSPRMAFAKLETARYDAIVTDLRMKELDGMALLGHAHATCPRLPVVMMSGHAETAVAAEAIRKGAFEFLQKPLDRDEFLAVLKKALMAHRLSRNMDARQFLLNRLMHRVLALDALIRTRQGPSVATPSSNQECITVSRQLQQSSLVLLTSSLERIRQRTVLAEATLRETEQSLLTAWREAHRRTVNRYLHDPSS
ncbi:MAG TPA: response regulator [Nitrospiraceae bacterium]|nr:response regulator [Nitrospiraceae bacterium]